MRGAGEALANEADSCLGVIDGPPQGPPQTGRADLGRIKTEATLGQGDDEEKEQKGDRSDDDLFKEEPIGTKRLSRNSSPSPSAAKVCRTKGSRKLYSEAFLTGIASSSSLVASTRELPPPPEEDMHREPQAASTAGDADKKDGSEAMEATPIDHYAKFDTLLPTHDDAVLEYLLQNCREALKAWLPSRVNWSSPRGLGKVRFVHTAWKVNLPVPDLVPF